MRAAVAAALLFSACAVLQTPRAPVQTTIWGDDGCSSSPDLGDGVRCCVEHDAGYRMGGDRTDRLIEDLGLLRCLLRWNVPEKIAWTYFWALRRHGAGSWNEAPARRVGVHRGSWAER